MKVAQLAWMAGVIETRGKIRVTVNPQRAKTSQLILQVQSQHLPIVNRLGELTGIKVDPKPPRTIESSRRACTEHCTESHVCVIAELPEMALWSISGSGAAIVLRNLMPYLVTDTGLQAVIDNIFASLPKTDARGRSAVDQSIIRLRKLGWAIPPAALEGFIGTPVMRGERGRFVRVPVPA